MMRLLKLRIRKLGRALSSVGLLRALRFGVAPSVEHDVAFRGRRFNTVIDIGANRGQFALFSRSAFPGAAIIAFEPIKECADVFELILRDDPRCRLHRIAIGSASTTRTLHLTSDRDSSSLLKPRTAQTQLYGSKVSEERQISVGPLKDHVSRSEIRRPALLKIDTQGSELDVLYGCVDYLGELDEIYVEASYFPLYEGQALVSEIIGFLNQEGFSLNGVFNQHVDLSAGPVQADFLFRRAGLAVKL